MNDAINPAPNAPTPFTCWHTSPPHLSSCTTSIQPIWFDGGLQFGPRHRPTLGRVSWFSHEQTVTPWWVRIIERKPCW